MDRPHQPRLHSASTPALVPSRDSSGRPQPSQPSPSSRANTGAENLRRGHSDSDGALAEHVFARAGLGDNNDFATAYGFYGDGSGRPRGGETWMDFLGDTRTMDGSASSSSAANNLARQGLQHPMQRAGLGVTRNISDTSSSILADRKRRLTGPESPRRRGSGISSYRSGPNLSGASGSDSDSSDNFGYSGPPRANVIDLTASSPPQVPPMGASRVAFGGSSGLGSPANEAPRPSAGRRESDIVLPLWQPDSEVSDCPVCSTQFSFWYRKHHCRKCGRVVCASCSPHRITIPRQFIVRPPGEGSLAGPTIIDLTGEEAALDFGSYRNPALGGGEEVRVCNPCVPDPNFSLPPQSPQHQQPPQYSRFPSFTPPETSSPFQHPGARYQAFTTASRPPPLIPSNRPFSSSLGQLQSDGTSPDPFRDRRTGYRRPSQTSGLFPPPRDQSLHARPSGSGSVARLPTHQQRHSHHGRPGLVPPSGRIRAMTDNTGNRSAQMTDPSAPTSVVTHPQVHRREVAEEDECWVCLQPLPPKGPNGETDDRERHTQECLTRQIAQFDSGTPPRQAASGVPGEPGPASNSGTLSQWRPRLLRWTAKEKDCVDAEGQLKECIICFEEFEEGVEMGRLDCLCVFHEDCIKTWWATKGEGSCPTHQLHS